MSFHDRARRHSADLQASHWNKGAFVSNCTLCGCEMEKLPGLGWKLRSGGQGGTPK